ncbi:metallophosphoesterase family protein [Dyella subtropica]|uniref:metallophosphoesterase family protein n=1 Tax=Dyella subtropica TaxID=2992127 RepID=UPI002252FC4B|nr:metallophosphoesterase [Dyella subtropica]
MKRTRRKPAKTTAGRKHQPVAPPAPGTGNPPYGDPVRDVGQPVFSQPQPTPDPATFQVNHPSDGPAYTAIDQLNKQHKLQPLPFPAPRGGVEPRLTLDQVLGGNTAAIKRITQGGQLVFHSTGDCGSTRGPATQNMVTDKMTSDFQEADPREVPQFNFLLGDIVYSFGEANYYYDQFYDPYRDYAAPILAVAGNHDGMVSPLAHATSLDAFLRNFCSEGFTVTPDAGGLSRTAQIQPGVFFTFEAPFVRIIALYSNTLEDPGVIADGNIGHSQLDFIKAALQRVKAEKYTGALLFMDHHPPYTVSRHGWSLDLLKQIDTLCDQVGVWPHAFLSGHAHNYQRFTRTRSGGTQIPYVVCGNGGHNVQKLVKGGQPTLRAPQIIQNAAASADQVVLENYDDKNYGYLRVIVDANQLRIEYHPATDGADTKTPDDFVTVDLATRKLVHYMANDLGMPALAKQVRKLRRGTKK